MQINPKLKAIPKDWLADKTDVKAALDKASLIAARYKDLFKKSDKVPTDQE